ncbi:MAG TPA: MASE1 domain-containing protein [Pyrinomonadaceae bacterium]|nr:MASE1 domain-containing protein [Pyrinomonadaceae bacterium]
MSEPKKIFGWRDVAIATGVASAYFLGAKVGLSLAFVNVSVSPVWPPAGIAIAAVLWFGYRATPGVFLGALLANYLLTDVSLLPTVVIAIGNTLEAIAAVYLLRRFAESRNPFNRAFDVLKFVVFAAIISTAVAATIGNLSLCISDHEQWTEFRRLWLTWWSGDAIGALLVAPHILSWIEKPVERWRLMRWFEFTALFILTSLVSLTIYTDSLHRSGGIRPWGHITIPLLVWAAFRFGTRGVSTLLVPLTAIAIWGTIHGLGGFAQYPRNEGLLFLQAYIADIAITILALAAIVTERKLAGLHLGGTLSVTRILAESPALDDAVLRIIQRICNTFEWEVGAMWRLDDEANVLKCFKFWPTRGLLSPFENLTKNMTFADGVGLPGRVWSKLRPMWIPDVAADDNFPRARAASAEELHAAFAFPIMSGEKFLGVMEFFSHEIREPDSALLATFIGIGSQIGQFLVRKGVEAERESLLTSEQVARSEAEEANRLKDEFLAMLSHELRTPLTAMLGWLSMLRSGRLDRETSRHALETVQRNAQSQAQLIEDLVDVSRIAGGKLKLDIEPVDLVTVITAAIEVVRPAANARGVSIEVSADDVGPVAGDAARLQQIIWNLLSNAVKFTERDEHVYISLRRVDSFAEVEVRDTGIGIDPEFLPRVFERFRQAESALTRSHRGLGLGLAIVRHLTELHGGTVTAVSEGEGKGSTFTLRIPLLEKHSASAAEMKLTSARMAKPELSGLRVLLVEDETDARELLTLALKVSGAEVQAVESAQQALADLQSFKPDVLLSDIGLPIESGYDLIAKIRALPTESSRIPAVALTAFAGEKDRQRALASGFQIHLAKPVEPRALIQAIDQLVNGKPQS